MHLVIIGNGISGITLARHVRKRDSQCKITVISKETDHFFSRTALMYIYMGHLTFEGTKPYEDFFWKKNRIDLVRGEVTDIDYPQKTLNFADKRHISYDKLVIACGSKPNYFGWPGQELEGVQGLYSIQDLERMEANTRAARQAVLVGGGLIGVEMAEMLLTRGIDVTFLVRESHYWGNVLPPEDGAFIGKHLKEHHVDLQLNTELDSIVGDDSGRVKAVKTKDGRVLDCQFVGLTAGVSPAIDFLKGGALELGRGVLVNDYFETNLTDVYAIGDCAEIKTPEGQRNKVEQLWYTGRMHGEQLAANFYQDPQPYDRGIWFNSAKFFDIEYQTYGFVPGRKSEDSHSFFWEAQDARVAFHVVFNKSDQLFTGMNAYGIRYRHKVFERWLAEKRDVGFVMSHLAEANFAPEFFKAHEAKIVSAFSQKFPDIQVQPPPRKKLLGIF